MTTTEMTLQEIIERIYDYPDNSDIDIVIDLSAYGTDGDDNE